ncbi:MAG TPA: hypothetical protein VH333_17655 [Pseudonocardiaceae bacterium]|jgi:hypothetical protein|nr:hypothetical protein [Pseudonocardiaceae bacterium]
MKPEHELAQLVPIPADLVPVPADRDLPAGRHRQLKDHLMRELLLKARPAPTPPPKTTRKWAIAATAVVITGTITGIVLAGTTSPAYAVEREGNGALITIHDASRLDGLSGATAEIGYPATVVPVTASCQEPQPAPIPANYQIWVDEVGQETTTVHVVGAPLPAGEVIVLGIASTADSIMINGTITSHVPSCLPPPAA